MGYVVVQVVEVLRYKPEGREFDFLEGHWDKSTPGRYGPKVDSASNRNDYQEYLLLVKTVGT